MCVCVWILSACACMIKAVVHYSKYSTLHSAKNTSNELFIKKLLARWSSDCEVCSDIHVFYVHLDCVFAALPIYSRTQPAA